MTYRGLLMIVLVVAGKIQADERELKDYKLHAENVIDGFGKQAAKDNDLVFVGSRKIGKLGLIRLLFTAYRKVGIDEARKLEVCLTEKISEIINNDQMIKPHLNSPIKGEKVVIQISFLESEGKPQVGDNVGFVVCRSGKVTYGNAAPETFVVNKIVQETYEEAYDKVMGKKE